MTPEGGTVSEYRDSPEGDWGPLDSVGLEDAMTTQTMGFDKSGRRMWSIDARGGDKARFVAVRPNPDGTFERETIFESDQADVADPMINPITLEPEAIAVNRLRKEWTILDPGVRPDLEKLSTLVDGEVEVVDRSGDDRTWVVVFLVDDGLQFWLWDRDAQEGRYLFTNRPSLEELPLVKMKALEIPAGTGRCSPRTTRSPPTGSPRIGCPRRHGPRRSVGPGQLGLQPVPPVARQPRLRGPERQLPGLDRLRQGRS